MEKYKATAAHRLQKDSRVRISNKLLNNLLYLNKMFFSGLCKSITLSSPLSQTFTIHRKAVEGEIFLTPVCDFPQFNRHLDISWVIIEKSSPLHISSC